MKLAVIGSTGHINYVFRSILNRKDVELTGIAPGSIGEDIGKLRTNAEKTGSRYKEYDDYRRLFDELKPDIAVVACFFGGHAEVITEALQRGIHVFAEKPIATTLEDLDNLRKVYAQSGAKLSAMFGLRYTAAFYTAWRHVREGAIGDVRLINTQKSYRLGKRGKVYADRKTYGGTIPWVGSHAIDWIHWYSGKPFVSVFASHSRMNNQGHGDLETSAICHFSLADQVLATVSIDYFRPENAKTHGDDRIRVVGTSGIVEVLNGEVQLINDEHDGTEKIVLRSPELDIFDDFVQSIKNGSKPLISSADCFTVTDACLRARKAADTNTVVFF